MTSGDLFIAFSTANRVADFLKPFEMRSVGGSEFSGLYDAAAQATEEAIINSLVAAETKVDVNGKTVLALPQDLVRNTFGR
jgi:D-aminopeptidase